MSKCCKEKASRLQHEAFMARALGLGEEDARKLENVAHTYLEKRTWMCQIRMNYWW